MLDAAHGDADGAIVAAQSIHGCSLRVQAAAAIVADRQWRRGPPITVRADVYQGSRVAKAVTRSSCAEQSLG